MNANKDSKKISVNYQILPFWKKVGITGGIFFGLLTILGATGTILEWSTLILTVFAFIVAFIYWYFTDVLIESGIKSDVHEELLNEIYKDVRYIKTKIDGKDNG